MHASRMCICQLHLKGDFTLFSQFKWFHYRYRQDSLGKRNKHEYQTQRFYFFFFLRIVKFCSCKAIVFLFDGTSGTSDKWQGNRIISKSRTLKRNSSVLLCSERIIKYTSCVWDGNMYDDATCKSNRMVEMEKRKMYKRRSCNSNKSSITLICKASNTHITHIYDRWAMTSLFALKHSHSPPNHRISMYCASYYFDFGSLCMLFETFSSKIFISLILFASVLLRFTYMITFSHWIHSSFQWFQSVFFLWFWLCGNSEILFIVLA